MEMYYLIDAAGLEIIGVPVDSKDEAMKKAEEILTQPYNVGKNLSIYVACVTDLIESKYEQVITKMDAKEIPVPKKGPQDIKDVKA